jgi:hypothetical protein
MVCGRGEGMLGRLGAEGRGAPGVTIDGGAFGASPMPAGRGCLGPERIWPGLGEGTGRAGIAEPLATGPGVVMGLAGTGIEGGAGAWATGATRGGAACGNGMDGGEKICPVDKGGRSGGARRTGAAGTSSAIFASGSFAGCSATGASAFGADGFTAGRARSGSAATSSRRETVGADGPPASPCTRCRTCSATSSSSELECVFLSAMPSSANVSRITLGFTSSSRASSLMRILLIR